jgi:glycerol-3-phosphate dehydrogenase (NAD(P)+)
MEEMSRLIAASGGRRETIYGVAGLGDLIATGTSGESRNRAFGEKLGAGLTASAARRAIPTVVEGVEAALGAHALARRLRVKTPVIDAIHGVVHRGKSARAVLTALGFLYN